MSEADNGTAIVKRVETPQGIVEYGEWTDEAVKEDEAEANKGGGLFYTLPEGKHVRVRFLPPTPEMGGHPFARLWQHFIKKAGKKSPIAFNCPKRMIDQACPVCQQVTALQAKKVQAKTPDERQEVEDAIGDLLPRFSAIGNIYLVSVHDVATKNPTLVKNHGPFLLRFGKQIWKPMMAKRKDPEYGNFTRPDETGYDFIIVRTGLEKNTEYRVDAARKNSALPDLGAIKHQQNVLIYETVLEYDEIVALLRGEKPQRERGAGGYYDEEEETERTSRAASGRSRRQVGDDIEVDTQAANRSGAVGAPTDDDIPF